MSVANPYQPPRAQVDDVRGGSGAYQPIRFWSSQGRIGRLRYLSYLMGGYLLMLLSIGAISAVGAAARSPGLITVAVVISLLPYLVFSVLMHIQRSHDMDWSGWASLLAFIPLLGLIWLFKPGTSGSNRFGEPPPPNTTVIKLLAFTPLLIGILAAVALPAYQNYVKRAKAAQIQSQAQPAL